MLFRKRKENNKDYELADRIRQELIATLRSKGINVSNLRIELKHGNINLSACIPEKVKV